MPSDQHTDTGSASAATDDHDEENFQTDGYSELSHGQRSEVGDAGRYQPAGKVYVINTGVGSEELDKVISTFNNEMRKNDVDIEAEVYDEDEKGSFSRSYLNPRDNYIVIGTDKKIVADKARAIGGRWKKDELT